MELGPAGFIKLPHQVTVDVNAFTAVIDTGLEVKLIRGQLYLLVDAIFMLTGQDIVQNSLGSAELAGFLCHADHAAEQAPAGIPQNLGMLLRRKSLFQPEPGRLPVVVMEQLQKFRVAPELRRLIPAAVKRAAFFAGAMAADVLQDRIIGMGTPHGIIDGLEQRVPGKALRERDHFIQIPVAILTAPLQVDGAAFAEF